MVVKKAEKKEHDGFQSSIPKQLSDLFDDCSFRHGDKYIWIVAANLIDLPLWGKKKFNEWRILPFFEKLRLGSAEGKVVELKI